MQENFRVKGKKLCFGFVDLEKAFDKVPSLTMRNMGVKESAVMSMNRDGKKSSEQFMVIAKVLRQSGYKATFSIKSTVIH